MKDPGCGIPEDQLPHVFDRFWQAPGVRRGAGLGLTIVRGIVEAHGGHVCVESNLGQGTTFFFTVPTARQAASPDNPDSPCHSAREHQTTCRLFAGQS